LQTSTQSPTFVLSHEITTSFLEKDIILISVRDTNIYFRLKNLQVHHLRENLPLLSSKRALKTSNVTSGPGHVTSLISMYDTNNNRQEKITVIL